MSTLMTVLADASLTITPESITTIGNFSIFMLIAAAGGGFFGAAIGGNLAFAFTGFMIFVAFGVTAATGSTVFFDYIAFGPVFGPHIAFAGGVAAAAYAGNKKKVLEGGGKDVTSALAGLGRNDVLVIGAVFGMLGYVIERLIALIPWLGSHTDTVALTVLTSGIIVRIIWGKGSFAGVFSKDLKCYEGKAWIRYHEKASQLLVTGGLSGLFAAGISLYIAYGIDYASPELAATMAGKAHVLPFAISAVTIMLLSAGFQTPVTHHMTIIGGLAAVQFFPVVGGNMYLAALIGVVFGILSAFTAEFMQRFMYAHGDTHIDPPAAAIWPMTTLVLATAMIGA